MRSDACQTFWPLGSSARPVLPLQSHVPERQTHDYIRHGTTTLFAALRLLDGVVIGECDARHGPKSSSRF